MPSTPHAPHTLRGTAPDGSILQLDADTIAAGLERLGFETFRPGQRDAVQRLLDVGRLLVVAPTGGGKSLTYQLPGSLLPGTTVVVSPLISLMHSGIESPDTAANRAAPPPTVSAT